MKFGAVLFIACVLLAVYEANAAATGASMKPTGTSMTTGTKMTKPASKKPSVRPASGKTSPKSGSSSRAPPVRTTPNGSSAVSTSLWTMATVTAAAVMVKYY